MSNDSSHDASPAEILKRLRQNLAEGGNLLVEELSDGELVAMQQMLLGGEAEIISLACRPYLSARLDRTIISH